MATATTAPGRAATRAGYAAAAAAFAFAAVNLYWALGGTAGLGTLGGRVEEMARAGDPAVLVANWASVVLKLLGGLLALALVRPEGRRLPRRGLLVASWGASALLVLYGGAQVAALSLVGLGVVEPDGLVDWTALRWRLMLWDLWFLVWGLLLAAATRHHARRRSPAAARRGR